MKKLSIVAISMIALATSCKKQSPNPAPVQRSVSVLLTSSNATATGGSLVITGEVSITATGADAFIPKVASPLDGVANVGITCVPQSPSYTDEQVLSMIAGQFDFAPVSGATPTGNTFKIPKNTTAKFVLKLTITMAPQQSYRFRMVGIRTFSSANQTEGEIRQSLVPAENYYSEYGAFN